LAQNSFNPPPSSATEASAAKTDDADTGNHGMMFRDTPADAPSIVSPANRMVSTDAVASLFGLFRNEESESVPTADTNTYPIAAAQESLSAVQNEAAPMARQPEPTPFQSPAQSNQIPVYQLQISGPGLNSTLSILEDDDLLIAQALLEKIRRQLKAKDL
jgi:hypothetical protein